MKKVAYKTSLSLLEHDRHIHKRHAASEVLRFDFEILRFLELVIQQHLNQKIFHLQNGQQLSDTVSSARTERQISASVDLIWIVRRFVHEPFRVKLFGIRKMVRRYVTDVRAKQNLGVLFDFIFTDRCVLKKGVCNISLEL